MTRCACILFHSNAKSLYKKRWVDKCMDSIRNQTLKADVFECNYGGGNKIYKGSKFYKRKFHNHIAALNFLITEVFDAGYDVCFVTNCDDFYAPERFELQLQRINEGFSLVSSNFYYITEINEQEDIVTRDMNMFRHSDIGFHLINNHNVIAHPCVAMHRRIWDSGLRYNEDSIGFEDMELWQKLDPLQISILQDYLLFYRIHDKQITKTEYVR
jgi:hypothetical protein